MALISHEFILKDSGPSEVAWVDEAIDAEPDIVAEVAEVTSQAIVVL
jgi:hypothetical protein